MASKDPIHIKESRKGSFTRAANAHHMSDAAFAAKVTANPDDYSKAMDKKADFAKASEKWHH